MVRVKHGLYKDGSQQDLFSKAEFILCSSTKQHVISGEIIWNTLSFSVCLKPV